MNKFKIANSFSGADLGDYDADTAGGALDAMARDAGYQDYDSLCADVPAKEGEIICIECIE